ncbi:hypothetical protein PBCV1_a062aR [Paramecium bursaria Chlorella virus 1]|uniref:Uncharacterized protein n=1 Tax=Paramecium bursaria Chlorella virus 1 TaxID=10506 RepID=F8TTW4_PBCV1|nr:hypothetical protein PBCV1_a062aR [Paramecium bursaria Chlorella virus 1]AEI70025.1 hypothetical protein [Paramecium bursaria Chlorella virus 1]
MYISLTWLCCCNSFIHTYSKCPASTPHSTKHPSMLFTMTCLTASAPSIGLHYVYKVLLII